MDQRSFDRLARLLGEATDRRAGLKAALGALLAAGGAAAALDGEAEAKRRRGKGAGPDAGRKKRKTCKPACGSGFVCRKVGKKRECRCTTGVECGSACCAAGQTCENGACAGQPEPGACIAFGERCKSAGRPCCAALTCGSGQAGLPDVACYKPAGVACAASAECVYGMECRGGVCASPPPAALGEPCGGSDQQQCVAPGICQDYTGAGAPGGSHCSLPLQAVCTRNLDCGCYRCDWPAAATVRSGRRNGRAAGGQTTTACCGAIGYACASDADCCEGTGCVGGVCRGVGCTVMPDGSGAYPTIAAALAAGATDIALGGGTYQESGLSVTGATVAIRRCGAGAVTVDLERKGRFLTVGAGANVTVSGITVTNGKVTGSGGGFDVQAGGALTLDGASVTDCEASANGGGINVAGAAASLTLVGSTVSRNTAEGNGSSARGGGIHVLGAGASLSVTRSTISDNTASNRSSTSADVEGGAIFVYGGEVSGTTVKATATIVDSTISGNSASTGAGVAYGGGIACGGWLSYLPLGASLDVTRTSVTGNSATAPQFGHGGGASLTMGARSTFLDCTVEKNSATNSGGGLYLEETSTDVTGGTISSNTAGSGGGLRVRPYGTTSTFESVQIADNENGGVVVDAAGTVNFTGTTAISNNRGRGLLLDIATVFLRQDTVVSGNRSEQGAGIFWLNGGNLTIEGTIRDNVSTGLGGGLFLGLYPIVTVADSAVITGNSATSGGGIYNTAVSQGGQLTIEGSASVHGNTATTGQGGGIYNKGILNLKGDAVVRDNLAPGSGGSGVGIYHESYTYVTDSSSVVCTVAAPSTPKVCGNPTASPSAASNCSGTGTFDASCTSGQAPVCRIGGC